MRVRGARGESLLHPPLGDFAAGREPDALALLHVTDDLLQGPCPARPAGYIGMELERAERSRGFRFFVEIVEKGFPYGERVLRISRIPVAVDSAVAEGLAGKLDQLLCAVTP